eukprot:TRINITY_DN10378_c0_g2_i1.p3 TRINITY_DN10378_c0_g2~~TRINITY_DN10378_c0_g2_i1.p3  ORF type:complete len:102 (+),score=9.72 TRINITY_DN10378_c0_g2_i1:41-307(+)
MANTLAAYSFPSNVSAVQRGSRRPLDMSWVGPLDMDEYCCLCMDNPKNAALIPCGHRMCKACAQSMQHLRRSCPLCNRDITDVLLLFG